MDELRGGPKVSRMDGRFVSSGRTEGLLIFSFPSLLQTSIRHTGETLRGISNGGGKEIAHDREGG